MMEINKLRGGDINYDIYKDLMGDILSIYIQMWNQWDEIWAEKCKSNISKVAYIPYFCLENWNNTYSIELMYKYNSKMALFNQPW